MEVGEAVNLLVTRYPRLYHMAEAGSWQSVARLGLLSTEKLLDVFEVDSSMREEILNQRRGKSYEIEHPIHGKAVVRDQLPLNEQALTRCLTDLSFSEWLDILNSRVFFWLQEERLQRLLNAKAYRERVHDVLVVDTRSLLNAHHGRVTIAPMNTGSTLYRPQPRGSTTFSRLDEYPFEDRRRRHLELAVELAVDEGVTDIDSHVVSVQTWRGKEHVATVWEG